MGDESQIRRYTFSGDITLRDSQETQIKMSKALDFAGGVEFCCADVTRVDLSFIQLLLAARKSALAAGIALTVRHPAGGVLAQALARAGIAAPDGNPSDPDHIFWQNTLEFSDGQYHPHGG